MRPRRHTRTKRTPAQVQILVAGPGRPGQDGHDRGTKVKRKRAFTFLGKLVTGAVKVWFSYKGVHTPFIVAVDDAHKITQEYIDSLE